MLYQLLGIALSAYKFMQLCSPGAKSSIKVTFNSTGKMGVQDKTVTLQSNAKQNPMVLHLKGTVEKAAEQPATGK